jgi:hypothetical protein
MHNTHLPIFLTALIVAIFATCPFGLAAEQRAQPIAGPLRPSGMGLLDRKNRKVRILGINSSGMEYGEGNEWNDKDVSPDHYFWATPEEQGLPEVYDFVAKSGFNSVRLNISWFNLERYKPTKDAGGKVIHNWNAKYLSSLDHVVDEYGKRGIAVILCMYQWHWSPQFRDPDYNEHGAGMPFWLYPDKKVSQKEAEEQFAYDGNPIFDGYTQEDGFLDAWRMVAQHFKGNSKVIAAEILNEPPYHEGWKLKQMYERVGHVLQSINPTWSIVVDQTHKENGLPEKPNLPSLIYAIHVHPPSWEKGKDDKPSGKAHLEKELGKSRAWRVPLYVAEFTKFGGKEKKDFTSNMGQMLQFCKDNDINWSYFVLQPTRHTSLFKKEHHQYWPDLLKVLQTGF